MQLRILDPRIGTIYPLPTYATNGSAGFDLRAMLDAPLEIVPGECRLVHTGIAVHIADPGYVGLSIPRSGLGHREGIVLGNGTGVFDSDYQGEILVSLWNRTIPPHGAPYTVMPGDRIAQFLLVPVTQVKFEVVETFTNATARAARGLGSTGVL